MCQNFPGKAAICQEEFVYYVVNFYIIVVLLFIHRHSKSSVASHYSVLDISCSSPAHTTSLLDQIFQFIGDQPEHAVSDWLYVV